MSSFTILLVDSRNKVSFGDILWNTTFWIDDFPLLLGPISKIFGLGSPVCSAAAEAYIDAYIDGGNEEAASEAAAFAYIDALEANPSFDLTSPCGRAAQSYIDTY